MSAKKQMKGRTKKARTARANGNVDRFTDIPTPERFDYVTRSVPTPVPTNQLLFRQLAPVEIVTASTAAPVSLAYAFALNGLAGSSTPAALFDFYKIEAVRMSVKPQNNAISVQDPSVTKLANLYWVLDYNDVVPPTVASDMTVYDNCMVLAPGESGQRTFRPKPKVVVNSAGGTDYMSVEPGWMPTTSDDVLHFGSKLFSPVVNGGQLDKQVWTVTFEYYIAFKKVT